jgi:hypothetical protein
MPTPLNTAPLTRDEVAAVIEGRGAARRVPLVIHMWVHPESFGARRGEVEALLARYPQDVQFIPLGIPAVYDAPADDPEYRWVSYGAPAVAGGGGIDAQVAIDDWGKLDDILAHFPDPASPHLLPANPASDGRYRLGHWWFCFFERHWQLRGMEQALTDYYDYPDEVHRLFSALTDFYCGAITRAATLGIDGIFTSDDLGAQAGPMFSHAIFSEFFTPYYRRLIDHAHALGLHFWLHACGNIAPFLEDFIALKLDVLHPIQKYTMDERAIAAAAAGRLTFWAGLDVQQTIPWGTPDDVRREVRFLIDTFQRPTGRLILGAGNGINEDCPLASLDALYDEGLRYGAG